MYPSDFYSPVNQEAITEYILNGTCNVMMTEFAMETVAEFEETGRDAYFADSPLVEPHSVVTRKGMAGDREFSDIATWTILALIYGEARNFTKDPPQCQAYDELPTNPAELDYMKAVHCVGNYGEITSSYRQAQSPLNKMNHLNSGQAMIAGNNLGNLAQRSYGRATGALGRIRRDNELRCGVFVPDNFNSTLEESRGLVGLSVDLCRTVSAAALNGDTNQCILQQFLYSDKEDAYRALNNGTVDLIAGALWEFKYDFRSSDDLAGVHCSSPYFYGDEPNTEDLSAYALATSEEVNVFSSFVDCVVVAMIWALERQIAEGNYFLMPLSSIFGR